MAAHRRCGLLGRVAGAAPVCGQPTGAPPSPRPVACCLVCRGRIRSEHPRCPRHQPNRRKGVTGAACARPQPGTRPPGHGHPASGLRRRRPRPHGTRRLFGGSVLRQAERRRRARPVRRPVRCGGRPRSGAVRVTGSAAAPLLDAARELGAALAGQRFAAPVHTVYAPLEYAWCGFRAYVERYAPPRARALFLGMNPGPFGMGQTGVPFGDVGLVRDWLGIDCQVRIPDNSHPRRPVEGFRCRRREVSGSRLWGLFRQRFEQPAGRNRTPDKLPVAEQGFGAGGGRSAPATSFGSTTARCCSSRQRGATAPRTSCRWRNANRCSRFATITCSASSASSAPAGWSE